MITTGRCAHLHQWWQNNDVGKYTDAQGKRVIWPLYESSPHTLGHVARQGGYGTLWVGKTQMKGSDLSRFGFDSVVTTPAIDLGKAGHHPHTDCRLGKKQGLKKGEFVSVDTGKTHKAAWLESSFFWQPSVGTINWPPGTSGHRSAPTGARSAPSCAAEVRQARLGT